MLGSCTSFPTAQEVIALLRARPHSGPRETATPEIRLTSADTWACSD